MLMHSPPTKCELTDDNERVIPNKKCIFPFIYKNETYYGCVKIDRGKHWCPTKLDSLDTYNINDNSFGYCSNGCAFDEKIREEARNQIETKSLISYPQIVINLPLRSPVFGTRQAVLSVKSDLEKCQDNKTEYDSYFPNENIGENAKCILKHHFELDAREICSFAENKTQDNCKCQTYESCEWSKNIVGNLSVLLGDNIIQGENSGLFQAGHKFVHSRTCNFATKRVYCCNERHYPSINQMKILRGLEGSEINTRLGIDDTTDITSTPKPVIKCNERTLENTRDSAKWKPDGDRGECGTPTILNNILAGEIAKNGEFPYIVILKYDGDEYKCGGSLINKRYVLTAKHCISDKLREAVFGDYILENDPDCIVQGNIKRRPPKAIVRNVNKSHAIIHEKYDIALIRLDELVPLHIEDPEKSIVAPVCLPWKVSDKEIIEGLEDNTDTLLAGWGLVTNLGIKGSNEQRT